MPTEDPPQYQRHDPQNGKKPDYSRKDPHPIPKYRQKDPHKVHPEQQPKGSKFWTNPPRSLDDVELLVRALEDLDVRSLGDDLWLEARAGEDPPPYSKHDPQNGKKPDYSRKDPHPIPKYRQKDPHKVHPEQQPKGSKFWTNPPRSLDLEEREIEEAWLEARAGEDPPPYSKHDPQNGKKPEYQRKDPHPIPKYRQKDPHKVHPEQQPKGSKFWTNPPRSLDLEEREIEEAWLEARAGEDPPPYSKHDPQNGKKPEYQRKDPHPIPKYRQKDPHKVHPEQQPKGSKFWSNPPREFFDWEDLE